MMNEKKVANSMTKKRAKDIVDLQHRFNFCDATIVGFAKFIGINLNSVDDIPNLSPCDIRRLDRQFRSALKLMGKIDDTDDVIERYKRR